MSADHELVLLTGSANRPLAKEIGQILNTTVDYPITRFANGETRVIAPFMRDREVYIIQPTGPKGDRSYMELFIMADAAKRAHAAKIIAVTPYFAYGRQDRKDQAHTAITAKLMAKLVEAAGIDHLITVDMHSDQQEGFYEISFDNLQGSYCLIPRLRELNIPNAKIVSPDLGGAPRARAYNRRLKGEGIAIGYKERDYFDRNKSSTSALVGEVDGYNAIIVDDQIDTGGSLKDIAVLLKEKGALKIFAVATHGVFSQPALDRINDSPIENVYITNSLNQPKAVRDHSKIEILSLAPLLSEVIRRIYVGESVGAGLID